jgi:hypothetical protein
MKGKTARDAPRRGNAPQSPSLQAKREQAAAGSVADASLRPLARALLALAEELLEREGKKG